MERRERTESMRRGMEGWDGHQEGLGRIRVVATGPSSS